MSKKSLLFSILAVMLSFVLAGCDTKSSCSTGKSFGTRSSITKKDITETCIKEIAKADFAFCEWNYKNEEETAKQISYLQNLSITFGKECKEKDQSVECPDFIPESLKLGNLSGCEVYSIDPHTKCVAPCADLYFSTNDDTFHTVYVGNESIIKSSDKIKEASFTSSMNIGSNEAVFTWSEKADDGSKIEKSVSVKMKVVDPITGDGEEEEEFEENNE
ncbi:hypothetical protein J6Z19_10100 [bacterium]|nr:hypothetical protein [bacterium]